MDKPFVVKEFDTIICNPEYKNESKYRYLPKKEFDKLSAFVREFNGSAESADVLEFMGIGYKRNIGDVVTCKNYVGLIELPDGFQLEVLPKISFMDGEDNGNEATKKTFLKMLRSLKDFPCTVFNDALLKVDKMNLYELFINMYLQELRHIVKHGIKSAYVGKEDNLHYFKGKLIVNEHLRLNMVHKERFYVSFEDFNADIPENRLIKSTLLKLQNLTSSIENSKEIRQLLTSFEMVEPSLNYQIDFSKVVIDRNSSEYKLVMQWSKVFLLNKSFTTFSGSSNSKSLLFPMETVFESYVAQKVRKIFCPNGWNVSCQDKGYYLFTEPHHQFALRPDIVLKKGERTVIMDTKWKSLTDNEHANYGISQSDMYQMYAYSKKYGAPEIWLLYPVNDAMRNHAPIRFVSGDNTVVSVHFVDVANIEVSLAELATQMQ